MHVDADRNGTVDDDITGLDSWTWGDGQKGAVILVNNDDDNSNRQLDNANSVVDGSDDETDLAPLLLKRNPPGLAFPAGYTARLTVSDRSKIRIFKKGSWTEFIGPGSPLGRNTITDLGPQRIEFGMEALKYPGQDPDRNFDGLITLTLEVLEPGGSVRSTQRAQVRVAPWLLMNHLDPTEEVYVVPATGPSNTDFRTELQTAVTSGTTVPAPTLAPARYQRDRWMQDVMEIGFSSMAKTGPPETWGLVGALRTPNYRDTGMRNLGAYAQREFLNPDRGFVSNMAPRPEQTWDNFGNLECSPFVRMPDGTEYKFGRIVHGNRMRTRLKNFLAAQKVQKPIEIDTTFLEVGHVDEILSFIPHPASASPQKFKLALASPQVAMSILEDVRTAGHGSARMFQGIPGAYGYEPREVNAFLSDGFWRNVQTTVQAKIDIAEGVLCPALNLDPANDVIKLPVLFRRAYGSVRTHQANTADVVNMLVVTKPDGTANLVIPKPFGPVVSGVCQFEEYIRPRLEALGHTVFFVDDFIPYHHQLGEIHCGTNSRRRPPTDRWWWQQTTF
jgi:protein-arginine deiminase